MYLARVATIEVAREDFGDPTDTKPVTRSLWFQTDLNRRRSPLQGDALPTEL